MISLDAIAIDEPGDARRYWLAVAAFVALLSVALVIVAAMGAHPGLRARRTLPADGAEVSVRPTIRAQFSRALDRGSVEGRVAIEPPVPFDLAWSESELRILPREALQPGVEYTVTVGPGVLDAVGTEMEGALTWRFRTRQPRALYLLPVGESHTELWMVEAQGERPRRLSAPGQMVRDFDASPDGTSVVFVVEESAEKTTLWRVDTERQGLTQLTREEGVVYSAPRFSPSGDLLAIEVRRVTQIGDQGSVLGPPQIELRRPTDGSPAGVIYGEEGGIAHSPRWSPDGTRMAFFEAERSAIGIFNFTRDILFYSGESATLGPQAWSPDGNALTYSIVVQREGGADQLLAVRDADLGTEALYSDGAGMQGEPAWAPDGSLIAYTYQPLAQPGSGLWIMRPDGTGRLVLVSEPNATYTAPLWSPDSRQLLFARFDPATGQQSIWTISREGGAPQPLAPVAFQAAWLP